MKCEVMLFVESINDSLDVWEDYSCSSLGVVEIDGFGFAYIPARSALGAVPVIDWLVNVSHFLPNVLGAYIGAAAAGYALFFYYSDKLCGFLLVVH
jgi:hypothetical protein